MKRLRSVLGLVSAVVSGIWIKRHKVHAKGKEWSETRFSEHGLPGILNSESGTFWVLWVETESLKSRPRYYTDSRHSSSSFPTPLIQLAFQTPLTMYSTR